VARPRPRTPATRTSRPRTTSRPSPVRSAGHPPVPDRRPPPPAAEPVSVAYGHRRGPPRRARPAAAPPTANRPPRTRPCAVRGGEPHDHESSPGTAAELATTARHHDHRTRRLRNHGPAVRYHRAAHPGRRGQRG